MSRRGILVLIVGAVENFGLWNPDSIPVDTDDEPDIVDPLTCDAARSVSGVSIEGLAVIGHLTVSIGANDLSHQGSIDSRSRNTELIGSVRRPGNGTIIDATARAWFVSEKHVQRESGPVNQYRSQIGLR
jgi:hypothetical protein